MCLTARFPRFMLAFTNSKKYKSIGIGQNTTKFDRPIPIPIPGKKADTTDTDTIGASLFSTIIDDGRKGSLWRDIWWRHWRIMSRGCCCVNSNIVYLLFMKIMGIRETDTQISLKSAYFYFSKIRRALFIGSTMLLFAVIAFVS